MARRLVRSYRTPARVSLPLDRIPMGDYESTRQRHVEYMMGRLPEHLERLTWSAERLRAERSLRLRELLRTARAHSSWHRSRLATVDVDAIDEDRLRELPIMTKSDLMTHFDEIVTDPRVTLDLVNAHLAGLTVGCLFPRRVPCPGIGRVERRAGRVRLGMGRMGRRLADESPAPGERRAERPGPRPGAARAHDCRG